MKAPLVGSVHKTTMYWPDEQEALLHREKPSGSVKKMPGSIRNRKPKSLLKQAGNEQIQRASTERGYSHFYDEISWK